MNISLIHVSKDEYETIRHDSEIEYSDGTLSEILVFDT
jgi:hypothetical protein